MNTLSSFLKYWKSYINIPNFFSLAVQTSHYMSHYGFVYKKDYHQSLPKGVIENMLILRKKLEVEISKNIWDDGNMIKLINVKCFYAAIMLTGDDNDKLRSIKMLEDTLVSYQQIPFQKFLDGIFVALIIGYFSINEHEKLVSTFKRYKKITANQIVLKDNDLTIDAYYFTTQYRTSLRKQYVDKLQITYKNADKNQILKHLIEELSADFKIPIVLN